LLILLIALYAFKGQGFRVSTSILLIPLLVLLMALFGLGLGIIISSLTTKYRDFSVLIGFAVQLLMYATPVAYPLSFLKNKLYASWISWNPLSPLVEGFRYSLFGKGSFQMHDLIYSTIVIFLFLLLGLWMFSKVERNFMDTV